MVKINNIFGDINVGKVGNTIYQRHYGQQIRRKGFKRGKTSSPKQVEIRNNFKEAVSWAKNLTSQQRIAIKRIYKKKYPFYTKGQPSTWYNFAKTLYMQQPHIQCLDLPTYTYKITHPAIQSINIYDELKRSIKSINSISSLLDCVITSEYTLQIPPYIHAIGVTTICDVEYIHFMTPDTKFYECLSFSEPCPNSK